MTNRLPNVIEPVQLTNMFLGIRMQDQSVNQFHRQPIEKQSLNARRNASIESFLQTNILIVNIV